VSGRFTRAAVSAAAVGCGVLGSATGAQASDASIRATVKSAVPKIVHSQARILDGLATYEKTHSPTALIKSIKAQNRDLSALETKVAGQTASTPNGTKGKADIVTGLRLIIGSNRTLTKELQRSSAHKPVSNAKMKAAAKADVKGNADLNAGGKLLSK
jgi:hypothetical protein